MSGNNFRVKASGRSVNTVRIAGHRRLLENSLVADRCQWMNFIYVPQPLNFGHCAPTPLAELFEIVRYDQKERRKGHTGKMENEGGEKPPSSRKRLVGGRKPIQDGREELVMMLMTSKRKKKTNHPFFESKRSVVACYWLRRSGVVVKAEG